MGRMLESFKLGEGRRTPLSLSKPADAAPAQDCVVDWEIGAEVPFVEVGGPNKKIELSPGLVQHPPQPVPQAPHLPVEPLPMPAQAKLVTFTETAPMTAVLKPWPESPPTLAVSKEIIAYHQPGHAVSKDYGALLHTMRENLKDGVGVLLLTGKEPSVGASTVLLNLAVIAARSARVAIVDVAGSCALKLGQADADGLIDVLDGSLALEHALAKTGIDTLHLLSAGKSAKHALHMASLNWLVACLRQRYDLIFIDGPTLADAALASYVPRADGIYLVLPHGESPSLHRGFAHAISRMGGRLCGLIHTHFEI